MISLAKLQKKKRAEKVIHNCYMSTKDVDSGNEENVYTSWRGITRLNNMGFFF